jgi:hypothetical protein
VNDVVSGDSPSRIESGARKSGITPAPIIRRVSSLASARRIETAPLDGRPPAGCRAEPERRQQGIVEGNRVLGEGDALRTDPVDARLRRLSRMPSSAAASPRIPACPSASRRCRAGAGSPGPSRTGRPGRTSPGSGCAAHPGDPAGCRGTPARRARRSGTCTCSRRRDRRRARPGPPGWPRRVRQVPQDSAARSWARVVIPGRSAIAAER